LTRRPLLHAARPVFPLKEGRKRSLHAHFSLRQTLLSALLLGTFATLTTSPAWADKGMLKILTEPGNAKIYINGKRKGNSPSEAGQTFAIKLDEGAYRIEAIKDTGGFMELYGANSDVYVAEDALQTITLKLSERPSESFRKKLAAKYSGGIPAPRMIKLPGGQFKMGCVSRPRENCGNDETPVHNVTLAPFEISATEVTFEQWDACVADGGCSHYPDDEGWGRANRPVINVSWDDVQTYIAWLNQQTGSHYRLPSEAEWEYAARAGSATAYSWGDSVGNNNANCDGCGSRWDNKQTAPVGSFKANAFGLYDMHGNVWEWTADCWHDSYRGAPDDGSVWNGGNCSRRVSRGGSWSGSTGNLRASNRDYSSRGFRYYNLGFRLSR
jgi:formylglycine-generating enzyme required for sulfatase activity